MKEQLSTFIIVREDRGLDPTTLVAQGLKIGRASGRDLLLNHPDVSRLHAGIKEIEGRFYLFNLSSSNSTTLNGRVVALEEADALASGDEIRIGPFFLAVERKADALQITVTLQFGLRIGEAEARGETLPARSVARKAATPAPKEVARALDLFWGKRTREKAVRASPLHPRRPPRLGKLGTPVAVCPLSLVGIGVGSLIDRRGVLVHVRLLPCSHLKRAHPHES